MADEPRYWLRLTYVERGRLALLSHLEVVHAIERAIRRAGLPFAVSQGFSPHMVKAFGPALPVGVGSECEIFDVRLTRPVPADEALAALQAKSAPDLMVTACEVRDPAAPSASVAFPFSTYVARLTRPVSHLTAPEDVTVVRKKKERVLHVDDFLRGGLVLGAGDGVPSDTVRFTLESKPTGSLRCDVLLRETLALANAALPAGEEPVRCASATRVRLAGSLDEGKGGR